MKPRLKLLLNGQIVFARPAAESRAPESHEDLIVSGKVVGVGIFTPSEVLQRFKDKGINVAHWARLHNVSQSMTYQILSGNKKGRRGEAHRIAVLLGIKEGVA